MASQFLNFHNTLSSSSLFSVQIFLFSIFHSMDEGCFPLHLPFFCDAFPLPIAGVRVSEFYGVKKEMNEHTMILSYIFFSVY